MNYKKYIDLTLTPENCEEKGYRFVGDEIYDPEAPYEARKDIENQLTNKGCKLGTPASRTADYIFKGLYAPLHIPKK